MKQDRLLRKKLTAPTSMQIAMREMTKLAEFVHNKLSQFTFSQLCTFLLAFYYVIWPNLKPEIRTLLNRFYWKFLTARNAFVSGLASRLIGITALPQPGSSSRCDHRVGKFLVSTMTMTVERQGRCQLDRSVTVRQCLTLGHLRRWPTHHRSRR